MWSFNGDINISHKNNFYSLFLYSKYASHYEFIKTLMHANQIISHSFNQNRIDKNSRWYSFAASKPFHEKGNSMMLLKIFSRSSIRKGIIWSSLRTRKYKPASTYWLPKNQIELYNLGYDAIKSKKRIIQNKKETRKQWRKTKYYFCYYMH